MGQNRLNSPSFKSYQEALTRWKGEKPKGKVWYRATYAPGYTIGSDKVQEAHAKHSRS